MSLPKSYSHLSHAIGIEMCGGGCPWRDKYHDTGYLNLRHDSQTMHWRERRVTRTGIKRYLMVASVGYVPAAIHQPIWFRYWRRIEWTRTTAKDVLRLTLPPEAWAEERARLSAMLARPDLTTGNETERARALRWTRRS